MRLLCKMQGFNVQTEQFHSDVPVRLPLILFQCRVAHFFNAFTPRGLPNTKQVAMVHLGHVYL